MKAFFRAIGRAVARDAVTKLLHGVATEKFHKNAAAAVVYAAICSGLCPAGAATPRLSRTGI